MSLIFAGITPHTPILMPTIGKEGSELVKKSQESLSLLEQELYITHPDVIVIITPHGEIPPNTIAINMNSKYRSNFSEFGDLVTQHEWSPATMLIDRMREYFKTKDIPLTLLSDEYLDYGTTVPLHFLTRHLPKVRILPIRSSTDLSIKKHYEFGKGLMREIANSTARIAIICSADLSHRVGENSPSGFSPKGIAYDDKVQEILTDNNPISFLDIDDDWIKEADACSTTSLAILFGSLDKKNFKTKIISYEKPLGVGYLVASINIS